MSAKVSAPTYTIEYPYTRTTGPVIGAFLTALRDGCLVGVRCGDRVICPPVEYDPATGATLEPDMVDVGPGGTVQAWTWVAEPTRKHPFREPFAFATILLDGADTPLVQALRARRMQDVSTGMRVRAQWLEERTSAITDVYFVPEDEAVDTFIPAGEGKVELTDHLISLDFREEFYPHRERYARALLEGRFLGQRSPASGRVYIPSKGYDPIERVRMTEADDVELPPVGTVVAYTVITPVQYYGQKETEPYIRASILLDGADQPLGQQDIRSIPIDEFRAGLRVRAVFRPEGERTLGELDNRWAGGDVIERWEPTGEPDVPFESFSQHAY